jgi:hypothetical protein
MNIRDTFQNMAQRIRRRARHAVAGSASQRDDTDPGHSIAELFDRLVADAVARGADPDLIASAKDRATQAAADVLTQRLQEDAPRMLREHRDFRRGFEQRLQQRWGLALDLYECVRVCCLEAGEDFHERLSRQAGEDNLKRSALTLLHARACLVTSEVQGLLRSGHAPGAQARWRTLHELAVIAFVLGRHPSEISEAFLLHRDIERHKDALQYQLYCEALGYEPFSDDKMDEIRHHRDELVARYGPSYKNDWGWATSLFPTNQPASFSKLEQLAGLEHFKPWFRLSSHGIHGGATGTIHIREFYGKGDTMLAGPSNAGLADPGNGALISLHQVTTALLLYGGSNGPELQELLTLKAIANLLDQAQQKFLEIHHALEAEEAAIRGEN